MKLIEELKDLMTPNGSSTNFVINQAINLLEAGEKMAEALRMLEPSDESVYWWQHGKEALTAYNKAKENV